MNDGSPRFFGNRVFKICFLALSISLRDCGERYNRTSRLENVHVGFRIESLLGFRLVKHNGCLG